MAQIFDIEQYRAARAKANNSRACYCDAACAARRHFASQLEELKTTTAKPRVLCLEVLEDGIPMVSGGWDLIYSASLFNFLPNAAARQVVKAAVSRLAAGGRLLIAGARPEVYMQRCQFCHKSGSTQRGELAMIELAKDLSAKTVSGQLVFNDASGLNIFLELYKSTTLSNELVPYRKVG